MNKRNGFTLRISNGFTLRISNGFTLRISNGFTLVELLVVIAILGMLMGALILLIDPGAQFKKARDARRKADLAQIQTALELYRSDWGLYPLVNAPGPVSAQYVIPSLIAGLTSAYIGAIPADPKNTSVCPMIYIYYVNSTQTAYALFASLENLNDSDARGNKPFPANGGGAANSAYTLPSAAYNCHDVTYNYWINSP